MDISKYNKKELKDKCSKILNSGQITEEDTIFLLMILDMHKERELKIGVGFDSFFTKRTPYGNLGFCIKRLDGTTTDFSFYKCISPPSKVAEVKAACRRAIDSSIKEKRTYHGSKIHHDGVGFKQIVKDWIKDNPDIDLKLNDTEDNNYETIFNNQETAKSFKDYHDSVAILIELSAKEHRDVHSKNLLLT